MANRLDEIFQLQTGIPIIGGMYLGMKEERAEEIVAELEEYKTEHSYDYPADLIFCYQISFSYQPFDDIDGVKQIDVKFEGSCTPEDYKNFKEYLSTKYYHKTITG